MGLLVELPAHASGAAPLCERQVRLRVRLLRQPEQPLGDDVALDLGGAARRSSTSSTPGTRARRAAAPRPRATPARRPGPRRSPCRARRASRSAPPAPACGSTPPPSAASEPARAKLRTVAICSTRSATNAETSRSRSSGSCQAPLATASATSRSDSPGPTAGRPDRPLRSAMSVVIATAQPCPTGPRRASSGTTTSSRKTSLNSASPVICRSGRAVDPRACACPAGST